MFIGVWNLHAALVWRLVLFEGMVRSVQCLLRSPWPALGFTALHLAEGSWAVEHHPPEAPHSRALPCLRLLGCCSLHLHRCEAQYIPATSSGTLTSHFSKHFLLSFKWSLGTFWAAAKLYISSPDFPWPAGEPQSPFVLN